MQWPQTQAVPHPVSKLRMNRSSVIYPRPTTLYGTTAIGEDETE